MCRQRGCAAGALLLFILPTTAFASEPIGTSPVPKTTETACAGGLVQHQAIIFSCNGIKHPATVRYLAPAGGTKTAFAIPAGTVDFEIEMSEDSGRESVDFRVYDPATHVYLIRPSAGEINDAKHGLDGIHVAYSGSKASPERIELKGMTRHLWLVEVVNNGVYPAIVTFNYLFKNVHNCSEPLVQGCKRYNPYMAQDTVLDWSLWAESKFTSSSMAWRELAGAMVEEVGQRDLKGAGAVVPYFKWGYVWDAWPHAERKGTVWQDAFHYIAKGRQFIKEADFAEAFSLAAVARASKACMAELRRDYGNNEAQAWSALNTRGASFEDDLFENCSKTTGVDSEKLHSFMHNLDTSKHLKEKEFEADWDQVNSCPLGYYRNDIIIWHCNESFGNTRYFLKGRQTQEVTTIPEGIVNMRIGITADQDVDLMLWDPATRTWVVKWQGGMINRTHRWENYPPGHSGVRIQFSGDETRSPVEEFVQIEGVLGTALTVQVNNFATSDQVGEVTYSWDRMQNCPGQAPTGCKVFDETSARASVSEFSQWMVQAHSSPEEAWDAMCSSLAAKEPSFRGPLDGVAYYKWKQVWSLWPLHMRSAASWQESFHLSDANADNIVDKREFTRVYRLHDMVGVVTAFFTQLHGNHPNYDDAWALVSRDESVAVRALVSRDENVAVPPAAATNSMIGEAQWTAAMLDFMEKNKLPDGTYVCKPSPQIKPYVFAHTNPISITLGMGTPSQMLHVARAETLGIVGGSFTALARIRMGAASRIVFDQVPHMAAGDRHVFSTPDATIGDYEKGSSLFLGMRDENLAMSFGPHSCVAGVPVPKDEWATVAWTYNATTTEQRLYLNGKTIKKCTGTKPFQGFGKNVCIGKCNGQMSNWVGELNNLYLFPSVLSDIEVASVFNYSPMWSMPQVLVMDENEETFKIGAAEKLGLQGGSFTILMRLLRSRQQSDAPTDSYALVGVSQDNSLQVVVRNGSLSISFGGERCSSGVYMPKARWLRVAIVYNARGQELLIFQDGRLVHVCGKMPPYQFADRMLWVGRSTTSGTNEQIHRWRGAVKDLSILNRSECMLNIEGLFNQSQTPGRRLASGASPHNSNAEDNGGVEAADLHVVRNRQLLDSKQPSTGLQHKPGQPDNIDGDKAIALETFRFVDINGDGVISKDEFVYREAESLGDRSVPKPAVTTPSTLTSTTTTTTVATTTTTTTTTMWVITTKGVTLPGVLTIGPATIQPTVASSTRSTSSSTSTSTSISTTSIMTTTSVTPSATTTRSTATIPSTTGSTTTQTRTVPNMPTAAAAAAAAAATTTTEATKTATTTVTIPMVRVPVAPSTTTILPTPFAIPVVPTLAPLPRPTLPTLPPRPTLPPHPPPPPPPPPVISVPATSAPTISPTIPVSTTTPEPTTRTQTSTKDILWRGAEMFEDGEGHTASHAREQKHNNYQNAWPLATPAARIAGMAAILVSVALVAARMTSHRRAVGWQAFERLPNEED